MRCETFTLHSNVGVAFTGCTEGNLAVHTVEGPSVAHVMRARERVAAQLGIDPAALAFMSQVHLSLIHIYEPTRQVR